VTDDVTIGLKAFEPFSSVYDLSTNKKKPPISLL